jgi:hypothetical protein
VVLATDGIIGAGVITDFMATDGTIGVGMVDSMVVGITHFGVLLFMAADFMAVGLSIMAGASIEVSITEGFIIEATITAEVEEALHIVIVEEVVTPAILEEIA